jgi:hypothetical protein
MFDLDELEKGTVRAVRQLIGNRLSVGTNKLANVFREYTAPDKASLSPNEKANVPDYPYASVHCYSVMTDGTWLMSIYQDVVDGKAVYVIPFIAYLDVTIHGRGCHLIATELKHKLEIDAYRELFDNEVKGALADTGDLPNSYDFMSTNYVPSTPLSFRVRVNSYFKDEDEATSFIERVIADGLYYRSADDPNPIPVHIDVNSTGV